jgi:hypothetical protein
VGSGGWPPLSLLKFLTMRLNGTLAAYDATTAQFVHQVGNASLDNVNLCSCPGRRVSLGCPNARSRDGRDL